MIQDILPEHFYNQYVKREPEADSRVLLFAEEGIYIRSELPGCGEETENGESLRFPVYRELLELCGAKGCRMPELVYLFAVERETYFLAVSPEDVREIVHAADAAQTAEGNILRRISMFEVRAVRPKKRAFAAATAWHLFRWYKDNRFCGRCGGMTRHGETLRMLECAACGYRGSERRRAAAADKIRKPHV